MSWQSIMEKIVMMYIMVFFVKFFKRSSLLQVNWSFHPISNQTVLVVYFIKRKFHFITKKTGSNEKLVQCTVFDLSIAVICFFLWFIKLFRCHYCFHMNPVSFFERLNYLCFSCNNQYLSQLIRLAVRVRVTRCSHHQM